MSLSLIALFCGMTGGAAAQTHDCPLPLNLSCGILDCRSPAHGVPLALWGEIQPVDTGPLPVGQNITRDNTDWSEYSPPPSENTPRWTSLDIEGDYLFAAINWGLEIWNLADPASPVRTALAGSRIFPQWITDPHEGHPVRDLDAPPGNNNVLAATVASGGGLAIFNTSNKNSISARYGDTGKTALQVYAGRIGSTAYSFTATQDAGLLVHNMTVAANLSSVCEEETPSQQSCGVYVGKLGSRSSAAYVDGVGNSPNEDSNTALWVAFSSAGNPGGLEIWEVSNPASPHRELEGLTSSSVHGVALWRSGSSYYLGLRVTTGNTTTEARIYNVSCIATGSCSGLGSPIWSQQLPNDVGEYLVTYSEISGRRFLYYGSANKCLDGLQGEWLFDVTDPFNAYDITPPAQFIDVFGQPTLTGYWGWYYRRNPTGYNRVMPRMGKFHPTQPYFYRAAYSIFDIHQLAGGVAPVANFHYEPSAVYRGQAVNFFDDSSGLPDTWDWTFQDATPATSGSENPTGVVFNSVGTKTVSLTVANGVASDSTSQTVTVLDPAAQVGGVTASPNPALVCQPVTFTATGLGGFPAPSLSWQLKDGGGTDVLPVPSAGNVNPFVWDTAGVAAGTYTATVTATNSADTDTATSPAVTIQALPPLPASGSFAPTNDPFTSGTVQFHVSASGATEWNWDFGDGTPTAWSNDPVAGPNPIHSYTQVGTYPVTVQVRNCNNLTDVRTSSALTVVVTQITPLVAHFQATQGVSCFGALGCFGTVNVPITFQDQSEGNPSFYDYDWNGDGTFEDQGHPTPRTSHTYTTTGTFSPRLRVRRGSESDTYQHSAITIETGNTNPPSISVIGPTTGQVNQALSFSATASNCTPSATGWSWSASGGGAISGGGQSISVTWSTTGTKTVSATNSACGSAQGSRPVSITDSGGGGNTLDARFTVSPANPLVGQTVTFDGTASTGSPQTYHWTFGDGGSTDGAIVTHRYQREGVFQVTLEVDRYDPTSCPPPFSVCSDSSARTVTVSPSGPPPLAASFSASVTCTGDSCFATAGEPVTLRSTGSGGNQFQWDFGDGGSASGEEVTHTWTRDGDYTVTLTVREGGEEASASKIFFVEPGALTASFSADVTCTGDSCFTTARQEVTLHSTGSGGSELEWDFGDGESASGEEVTHAWSQEGEYTVTLTARDGELEATASKIFFVDPPEAFTSTVLLPWIADTSGALEQTSDLYVTNPGDEPMEVTITFRKRGQPENPPPSSDALTVAPHGTLYFPDALVELFDRNDTGGFLIITAEDVTVDPGVVSLNRTRQSDGTTYGQMVPGITLPELDAAADAGAGRQYLLGLTDTDERHSYFGITNPHEQPAVYTLTFYDQYGELINGPSPELSVAGWGQKQFQIQELRDDFGLVGRTDYRVEIDQLSGETLYPYGGVIRQGTQDPSFVRVSVPSLARTYLVGAASTTGFNNAFFQTDAVLSNPTGQVLHLDITYRNVGVNNEPEAPRGLSLQPMETRRIQDVLFDLWSIETSVGVLTFESAGAGGLYPMIHGETYQNSGPRSQFGLFMPARRDDEAAGVDQRVVFTGLRQLDGDSNTTVWLFNPSEEFGRYDLVYYALDGTELGREVDYRVGPHAIRQINPTRHLLPPGGVEGGFALEVHVRQGQLIGGANVVINQSNDPAYVAGAVR